MTAFLPQNDPNRLKRERELEKAKRSYQYNYTHVSPLALLDRVPIHDEFSFDWLATVSERVMTGLDNMAAVELDGDYRDHIHKKRNLFTKMIEAGEAKVMGLKNLVSDALKFNPRIGSEFRRPVSLDDYVDMFHVIGLPPVARDFQDDSIFAWMRLGGPNSVMLKRVTELDDAFPVQDAHLRQASPDDSLKAALGEARLYEVDYDVLDGVELNDFPHGQKYVYAPRAMFVRTPSGKLLPFAIQCKQKPGPQNPIFAPGDKWNWLIAKTIVEVADGNVHEAATHLGRTHMFMEPFVVSTYRQLAPSHPVACLLAPHFEGTLAINEAAWKHLIADKGAIDKLFGASIKSARELTVKSIQQNPFNEVMLPATFEKRGVADANQLPDYPYRDDALLYWNAIHPWVADYLKLYYPEESDPAADAELQAWYAELVAADGGRVIGFGENNGIHTRSYLADALTLIIYTCSVQHAAVNFPQYDLMSYVPNMPLAAYQPAPTTTCGATEQDYLDMLPPLDMAELQQDLGYLLGSVHYTQLGQYGENQFRDPRVESLVIGFQQNVTKIGGTIEERNKNRRPYEFLLPQGVPQSINI